MFEKYFVTCRLSQALRAAAFDEPCMAVHEYYELDGKLHEKFIISYNNQAPDPEIYVESIRKIIGDKPGLFVLNNRRQTNSQLQPWLYAAPLYDQVFEWFEARGLYLHDYRITANVNRLTKKTVYGTSVFDDQGMQLWPIITNIGDWDVFVKHSHDTLQLAWEQAILAAINLLTNEPKMDV